ncbi:MAG: hypothetical protein F6K11_25785, partial [Leptolyngbya sp. SIO3F4]|nr:hypothetical protein [Leptolyngbya sp. SIO3F4]
LDKNYLTIQVEYEHSQGLQQATLEGHLNEQGIFNGTYQTRLPGGQILNQVRLNFDHDGSAYGVSKNWGRTIAIQRVS